MEGEAVTVDGGDGGAKLTVAVGEFLKRILRAQGARADCDYEIEQATAKGENYIGVLYRITAEAEHTTETVKQVCCLVKVPPTSPARRTQFFVRPCFLREAMAYEQFLPLAERFQKERGILSRELRFHEYPKCFGATTAEYDEAIFMENMNLKGFQLFDRFKVMDLAHVGLVMRAYGKLHAVSLALKDQTPTELKPFQSIVDIFAQRKDEEMMINYLEHLKTRALKSLHAVHDESYYKILKKVFDEKTFFDLLLDCVRSDDCEPYAVVGHGDCWNNNFLFKYEHNTVLDVCIVDWQLMRYASPVTDLLYFIFTNTTRDFRKKHYVEAIDIYYDELSAHLKRLGLSAEKLFPRNALGSQLKRKGAMGLLFAMVILPIITCDSKDVPDLEELSQQLESGEELDMDAAGFLNTTNTNLFEKRMREVIIDVIDYGYLS